MWYEYDQLRTFDTLINYITIRDFERKDAENLYQIVRDKNIFRFMPDWAEKKIHQKPFGGISIGTKLKKIQRMFMRIKDMQLHCLIQMK